MINELMTFRKSLESWGITLDKGRHTLLNANSINERGLLVSVGETKVENVTDFPAYNKLCNFVVSRNFKIAFSFKFEPGKDQSMKIGNTFDAHAILYRDILHSGPRFRVLGMLVERLEKIGRNDFEGQVREFLKGFPAFKSIYLSLDIAEGGIQSDDFMDLVSEQVYANERQIKGGIDVFGKPMGKLTLGKPKPYKHPKADIGLVPVFARNKDRPSYKKFGLSSTDTCPLGPESEAMINSTVKFVFQKEKKATADRPGIWYPINLQSGKDAKSLRTYYVMTSLFPNNPILEVGRTTETVNEEAWEEALTDLVGSMRAQKELERKEFGQVTVIAQLTGAWHVDASFGGSIDEICNLTERWLDGFGNGPLTVPKSGKALRCSILTYLGEMNRRWKRSNGGASSTKTKDLTPRDAYNLFFDKPFAAQKAASVFAERHDGLLLNSLQLDQVPFSARFLVPIRNLILSKLGYHFNKEMKTMEHWAWYVGAALMEANKIYRKFFLLRRCEVPKQLVAQRFIGLVSQSPRVGFDQFLNAFTPALTWAQQNGVWLKTYRDHVAKIVELSNGELPVTPSPSDRLLINAGYLSYAKYDPNKIPSSDVAQSEQPTGTEELVQ